MFVLKLSNNFLNRGDHEQQFLSIYLILTNIFRRSYKMIILKGDRGDIHQKFQNICTVAMKQK